MAPHRMEPAEFNAQLLAEVLIHRSRLTQLPADSHPKSIEEAYRVRECVVERWLAHYGGVVTGYKIACTNPSAQRYLNLDAPFYGNLYSALTYDSPARLNAGDFFMRVMEAEFAFLMARDLEPGPHTRDEIVDAVEGVLPGIEIVDSRYTSWTTAGAAALIADNACHGAWVKGELVRNWRGIDLATQPVQLLVNRKVVSTGSGAAVLGHPLNALEWLVNRLGSHGAGLKAGEYITTGVTTDTYMASAGDHVCADFGAVGAVELTFE
jgi:2-keto-4-pentenoate hydratase